MAADHRMSSKQDNVVFSSEAVPSAYQEKQTLEVIEKYKVIFLSKHKANEKDIAVLYRDSERLGWLIPAISMISSEHQRAECKHFHFFASLIFSKYKDQILDERTYFLIFNVEKCNSLDIKPENFSLNFISYGIYPFHEIHSSYTKSIVKSISERITIKENFDTLTMKGYIKILFLEILPRETNLYARFMCLYQFFEILFDLYYHAQINLMKKRNNHLGQIREKIADLANEKKIILKIYEDSKLDKHDHSLSEKCSELLGDSRDKDYYENKNKSMMIYDVRNTFVHSFHRFEIKNDIAIFFTDYLENEVLKLTEYIYSENSLRALFYDNYFE